MKIGASKFFLLILAAFLLLSCDEERLDETVNFIPGKPLCLQESLALADSLVIYNAQGLAYSTNKLKEIKRFAKAAALDEEYPEYDRELRNAWEEDAQLSISLFRQGKLVDYFFTMTIYILATPFLMEICSRCRAQDVGKSWI